MSKKIAREDYRTLADFRRGIRGYIRFSERTVKEAALEPRQYQLLLALKGLPEDVSPRIAELAQQLQIQHHSAVELIDRLEERKLVRRERGTNDRREVLVRLTPVGDQRIAGLVSAHLQEVFAHGPALLKSLQAVLRRSRPL